MGQQGVASGTWRGRNWRIFQDSYESYGTTQAPLQDQELGHTGTNENSKTRFGPKPPTILENQSVSVKLFSLWEACAIH
jgi:hypothetical protein